jgi:hypothetical protein
MRHNQNRRSRGRSRKGPNPLTRSYESNGPDVKVRGTAAHVAEKYMTLARDAQSSGDSVAAENYLQHAEHYIRIVMAAQAQLQPMQPNQFRDGQDEDDDDRQLNGRIRDRFDSNGRDGRAPDDELEGDEGDEEDDRTFQPVGDGRPLQQPRPDNRGPYGQDDRGPRPDRQFRPEDRGYRGDNRGPRPDNRNQESRGNDNRGNDNRGNDNRGNAGRGNEIRGNQGNDTRGQDNRPDNRGFDNRQDGRNQERHQDDRGPRPNRFEPRDRPERFDAPRQDPPEMNGQDHFSRPDEGQAAPERIEAVEVAPVVETALPMPDEAPAAPRKRRGRPPRVVNGGDSVEAPEVTPDGAAALAAFPE